MKNDKSTVTISTPGMQPVTLGADEFSKLAARIGADNQLIYQAVDALAGLLQTHWAHIRKLADQLDEEGETALKSQVSVKLVFDFSGKTPCGSVNIAYALKTSDGTTFRVEDAQQTKLPLASEKV